MPVLPAKGDLTVEMKAALSRRRRRAFAVLIFSILITITLRLRCDPLHPGGPHWDEPTDHHKYIYMAEHPVGSFHIQPMCWRIGVPLLARALPLSTYRSFDVLSVTFLALCGPVLYLWVLALPTSENKAFLAVLMFYSMGGVSKLLLSNVATPDPASYFFILAILYAMQKDKLLLCAILVALGVTAKETVLLTVPLYYTLKCRKLWDPRYFLRVLTVGAVGVCALITIRTLIPAWNDRPEYVRSLPSIYTEVAFGEAKYDLKAAFHGTINEYRKETPIDLVRIFTYGSLGILFFLPLFAPSANQTVLIRWLPYWLPVLASLLIAVNPDRRVSSLFPVLIVAGLNGIKTLQDRLTLRDRDLVALFSVLLALLLLKKNVPILPFDLSAATFLVWLSWVVGRDTGAGPIPQDETPIRKPNEHH
jgi:hypothetical protein